MLMGFLSLFAFSFAGGIIWVFNVETAAMVYGARSGWHPLLVGLACAGGQSAAYTFLFFAGDWLFRRWRWGRAQVERTRARYGSTPASSFLLLTVPAALVGIPPMTAMAALAGGCKVRLLPMIALAFSFRLIRFTILASAGTPLVAWCCS